MRMINRLSLRELAGGLCVLTVGLVTGCHQYPDVFFDDLPRSQLVTTNSAYRARLVESEPVLRDRGYELTRISEQDGTVVHGPLWFEDEMEDVSAGHPAFEVTGSDLYATAFSPVRFVANVILLPITMLVHPPGEVLCSDGNLQSRRMWWTVGYCSFDPETCLGQTVPVDVVETWTFRERYGVDESEGAGETESAGSAEGASSEGAEE